MSRVGKKPVAIPAGVTVSVAGDRVSAKGPKGELSLRLPAGVGAVVKDGALHVTSSDDTAAGSSQHGLARIVEVGFFAPGRIAPHIEQGQFVADAHERRNLLRRLGFEQSNQLSRIVWKQGRAMGRRGSRGIVIQRFGRR